MNPLLYHRFLYFPSHHLNFLTLEKQIERLEHYSSWSLSLLDWVQLLICRSKPKLKLKYISAKALAQLQKSIVKSNQAFWKLHIYWTSKYKEIGLAAYI